MADRNNSIFAILLGGILAVLFGIWRSVSHIGKDVKHLLDD